LNTYTCTRRGCETWIVREGYEGLVRGNADAEAFSSPELATTLDVEIREPSFIKNLRFGDGALLRDGTGDHAGGRTLKGRYIVRVGWDDVRGWFAEVCAPPGPPS
jgi:6-phosphofructokinase 1